MSLNCEPKKPTPSYLARTIQETYRDIGLSPIFNVNSTVSPCVEDFTSPTYYMSGTTKPMTGLTITSVGVYNLSEVDNFDIDFIFTGSTDYIDYEGQFCYKVIPVLPSATIQDKCTDYSDITGSSVTYNFTTTEMSPVDNEYYIRPYDRFKSKCYTDRRGRTGLTIDISDFTPLDTSRDDYIVTIVNPPKSYFNFTPFNMFGSITFVNETLYPVIEGSNSFQLTNTPVGSTAVIALNGITLIESDYTIDYTLVTITSGITLESTDVIQAYYNKTGLEGGELQAINDLVRLEIFAVTGVTTGVTSSFSATTYENFVNYNDVNDRVEIFLKENIDPSIQPVLTINGVNVAFNVDFFKSTQVPNKLILNQGLSLNIGDIVTVYYYFSGVNNPGDLGKLYTDRPTINWSSFTNITRNIFSYGDFTVEIAERGDIDFNTILNTGTTLYNSSVSDYTLTVGPITTTSIKNYIYRVKMDKYYVDTYKNVYKTTSYSDIGSFRLDWDYISNSNF